MRGRAGNARFAAQGIAVAAGMAVVGVEPALAAPSYHTSTMELRAELARGDLYYEYPFTTVTATDGGN